MKKHVVEQEQKFKGVANTDKPPKGTPAPKGVSSGIPLLDKAFQRALKTKIIKKK